MNKKILALTLTVFGLSTAFAANQESKTDKHSDGQIVSFLEVVNKNEIGAGKLAQKKADDKDVKDYANLMVKDHGNNLKQTMKVSKDNNLPPVASAESKDLKAKGKKDLSSLKPLKGKEFDKGYMDAMVKGHTDVLSAIDNHMKNVVNPNLKNLLSDTRTHVAQHLDKAKNIQQRLG